MENTQTDALEFQTVDTGDFDFHDFKENPTFVGEYLESWTGNQDGGTDDVTGLVFREHGTGDKVILPRSYQLEKLFHHKQSETPIEWDKNPVFQITRGKDKELKGGKTVATFTFKIAYPNQ